MSGLLLLRMKSCHVYFLKKKIILQITEKALWFFCGNLASFKSTHTMYILPQFFKLQNLLFGENIFVALKRKIK